jgi:8-oxo-dGTP diphosphatase
VARLRAMLPTTNVAGMLLPPTFTLGQLQRAHEAVLGHPLDTRNFRKRVLEADLIAPTGDILRGGRHRPARLYRMKQRKTLAFGRGFA